MKKLFFLSTILFLTSCTAIRITPLKGTYPQTPIIYYSDKSFDKVWDNIIDLFAQKGLSIRIIDRSSGLIISTQSPLSWAYEDKKGILKNPKADVAIPLMYNPNSNNSLTPTSVTGEWNIRIKAQDGKTSINVNLVNITRTQAILGHPEQTYTVANGKTTGNFERFIYGIIK